MISIRLTGHLATWPSVWHGKNFNIAIFLEALSVIEVKLCMVVELIEFYSFIPWSVTSITFQGHSGFFFKFKVVYFGNFFLSPI